MTGYVTHDAITGLIEEIAATTGALGRGIDGLSELYIEEIGAIGELKKTILDRLGEIEGRLASLEMAARKPAKRARARPKPRLVTNAA